MTVLSRGARVRRGGRRPGWVLLTVLLVLAMGASSALVFTNRVELLRLAVILALWAAVAGAFVSVLYRRQSDADQSRVRDLKLVYDLQLDREISARHEYELTVETQLRRELASELRAQTADDVAALRAELSALRTNLEILFDTDLRQHPALEIPENEAPRARAYSDWDRDGDGAPVDWVSSDRVRSVSEDNTRGYADTSADETAIIDVPEEPLLPPRQPPLPRERVRFYEAPQEAPYAAGPPPEPEPRFESRQQRPLRSEPPAQDWEPDADRLWVPPGTATPAAGESSGRRRRARHFGSDEPTEGAPGPPVEQEAPPEYGESGRRSRSRHSAEYRDFGVRNFTAMDEPAAAPSPVNAPAAAPPPPPPSAPPPATPAAEPPPPRLAPPPSPEPAPRHRGPDTPKGSEDSGDGAHSGGYSVAELLARLQVEPSGGGRRLRREGRDA